MLKANPLATWPNAPSPITLLILRFFAGKSYRGQDGGGGQEMLVQPKLSKVEETCSSCNPTCPSTPFSSLNVALAHAKLYKDYEGEQLLGYIKSQR